MQSTATSTLCFVELATVKTDRADPQSTTLRVWSKQSRLPRESIRGNMSSTTCRRRQGTNRTSRGSFPSTGSRRGSWESVEAFFFLNLQGSILSLGVVRPFFQARFCVRQTINAPATMLTLKAPALNGAGFIMKLCLRFGKKSVILRASPTFTWRD